MVLTILVVGVVQHMNMIESSARAGFLDKTVTCRRFSVHDNTLHLPGTSGSAHDAQRLHGIHHGIEAGGTRLTALIMTVLA